MPRPARLAPLLLALVLASAGCSASGRVESALEARLPEAIGPAADYAVEVDDLRARAGTAGRVTVAGRRVQPEDAPVLDRLDLVLYGVVYDRDADRLERVDSARATARLLPADLADFLTTQRGVEDAAVTVAAPDRATIRLRPDIGGLSLPAGASVALDGRLRAVDGAVRFEVEALRAGGLSLGGGIARGLSELINPLVDLADLPAGLRVTAVRAEPGALVVEAAGDGGALRLP